MHARSRPPGAPSARRLRERGNQVFAKDDRRDFVIVLEDRNARLIGFAWGKPHPRVGFSIGASARSSYFAEVSNRTYRPTIAWEASA